MPCKQCGKCCNRGDFWHYSKHPLVQRIGAMVPASNLSSSNQCYLLLYPNICLIEKYLGRDAKPEICKDYDCEVE